MSLLAATHLPIPTQPPPARRGRATVLWLRSKLSLCGLVILPVPSEVEGSEAKNLSAELLHRVQHLGSKAELERARFLLSQEKRQ